MLWPLVYSVAWSAAAWPLGHRERIVDWGKNDLSDPERIVQLNYLLGAGAIMFALLAAFLALTEHVPQKALAAALKGRFHGPVLEKNLELIAKAAGAVEQGAWKEKADA